MPLASTGDTAAPALAGVAAGPVGACGRAVVAVLGSLGGLVRGVVRVLGREAGCSRGHRGLKPRGLNREDPVVCGWTVR